MNAEAFENWCQVGRKQRETTWPEAFMPVIALITPDAIEVYGLGVPTELWPNAFEAFRKEKHPTDAVLTSDSHFRTYRRDETMHDRPRDDPGATDALVVLAADGKARALPYSVHDDGSFDWLEEQPSSALFGPISEALAAMVRP